MRSYYFVPVLLITFFCFCSEGVGNSDKNIFQDKTLRDIYDIQDHRNSTELIPYLKNSNKKYRKYAALAFASVQDKKAVGDLLNLLSDKDPEVRMATAYALGQIADIKAEPELIKIFKTERSDAIKVVILESLGKCGGEDSLIFLSDPGLSKGDPILMKGQAKGLYRFVLRKKYSSTGLRTVVDNLLESEMDDVRFFASNLLARIKDVDLSEYFERLKKLIGIEKNVEIKMNLILALGKCKGKRVVDLLGSCLNDKNDEKIIVNSIRALGVFDYNEIKSYLLNLISSKAYQISVASSEVLLKTGSTEDIDTYLDLARKTSNWRVGANLFRLSLRMTREKGPISSLITGYYKKSIDPYQKGALLIALSEDPENYAFVENEIFRITDQVVSTAGMTSISLMLQKKGYDPEQIISGGKGTTTFRKVFADIFKRGILSNDIGLITISSSAFRDPRNKFREVISDLKFLEISLMQIRKPEIEAKKREVRSVLNFFRGIKERKENNLVNKKPLNWEKIVLIPAEQKVRIVTDEGNILIKLYVNDAPGSVSNFLDLINNGYLAAGAFHRVVPNFVIQDGCPRGDGWGGPEKTIRSEFSRAYYEEGSVGMASSGKDTEGSQWFITHSSTPHLDGRYTIFGRVVKGMEVVNRIKVGTRILRYTIL